MPDLTRGTVINFRHVHRYSKREEQILAGLEAIFLAEGFRQLTLAELTKQLKCSLRSLYQLAPTKEELFLLVLNRMFEQVGIQARQVVIEQADHAAQIEVFLNQSAAIFRQSSPAFLNDIWAYGPASQLFQAHRVKYRAFLARIVTEGIAIGRFRPMPPLLVAKSLETLSLSTLDPEFLGAVEMEPLHAQRKVIELVLQGLSASAVDQHSALLEGNGKERKL